jgi:hypothetical protein
MKATHLVIGGLTLAALVVTYGAVRAANTGSKLEFEPLPKFRKLDFEGLEIEIDAKYKNPTGGTLSLRNPVIVLSHQDRGGLASELMRVNLTGRTITFRPKAEGKLSDPDQLGAKILVKMPYSRIMQVAPEAISAILGISPPYVIDVTTTATIEAPNVPTFRFTDRQSITLQMPIA